jgi:hypothetical protein
MRTVGGALGGQLAATFITDHTRAGVPTVTGFSISFIMSTGFLIVCTLAALLVPGRRARRPAAAELEPATAFSDS